jgi:hypothetical protein
MAYHHIPSISGITQRLSGLLKPGGQLLVSDYELTDGSCGKNRYPDIVAHPDGITRETIQNAFSEAGLDKESFTFDTVIEKAKLHGRSVRVFLAGGVRPGH